MCGAQRAAPTRTGFTLPTLFRWVRSDAGLAASLHPYRKGHYLGSGQGEVVLEEAGLDGASQAAAIAAFLDSCRGQIGPAASVPDTSGATRG